MYKKRLEVLLKNFLTYFDTELLQHMTLEEKIDLIKDEIGFTDREIEELNLIEECLK